MVSYEAANLALSFGVFTLTIISVILALLTLNKKKKTAPPRQWSISLPKVPELFCSCSVNCFLLPLSNIALPHIPISNEKIVHMINLSEHYHDSLFLILK